MKKIILFSILTLGINAMAVCPDPAINEAATDCPWAEMAREISAGKKNCDAVFKNHAPEILKQLKGDSSAKELIDLWGQAKNFDEGAKGVIVEKPVLECLSKKLKIKNAIVEKPEFNLVHAGLQHTYAYLFSTLVTKYGFKRDRWVKDDLKLGLGLTPGVLSPDAKDGSFLANVTYLFSKLTFGVDGIKTKNHVAKEILDLDPKKYQIRHLREVLSDKGIVIHTHFVKLNTEKLSSKNTHLLIYWIEDTAKKKNYFISGFPVDTGTVDKAFDPQNLGEGKPVATRYNAWVPGVTDSLASLTGLREEVK